MDSNSDRWEESQPSCHRRHHRGPSSRKTCFQWKIMSGKKSKKSFCEFFSAYRRSVSLYSSIRPTLRNALMIEKQLSRFFSSLFFFFCENSIESEKRVFFNTSFFWLEGLSARACWRLLRKLPGNYLTETFIWMLEGWRSLGSTSAYPARYFEVGSIRKDQSYREDGEAQRRH